MTPRFSQVTSGSSKAGGTVNAPRWPSYHVSKQKNLLHSQAVAIVDLVLLVLALFLRDIFVLAQVPTNTELDVLLFVIFLAFAFESIGLTFTDATYLGGCLFWVDLVGTLSMMFDISFLLGDDATLPIGVEASQQGRDFGRAARAAKLAARAVRLARVLKILRFMPFMLAGDARRGKASKAISNKLNHVLSCGVVLQAVLLVTLALPLFSLFMFPEVDGSMRVWTELLSRNAAEFIAAKTSGDNATLSAATANLRNQLQACRNFYSEMSFVPYSACYGNLEGERFVCSPGVVESVYPFPTSTPRRRASIREMNHNSFQVSFDLSHPMREEAAAALGLIWLMIVAVCVFVLVMRNSISTLALRPLEWVLSTVREHCGQIFQYADDLQEAESKQDGELDTDHTEQVSEFILLEKVVAKLAAIAHLTSSEPERDVKQRQGRQDLNENDTIMLNWMQGFQARSASNFQSEAKNFLSEAVPLAEADDVRVRGFLSGAKAPSLLSKEVLDTITTDDFNPLDVTKEVRIAVAAYILNSSQGITAWVRHNVAAKTLLRFVSAVEGRYLANPFHNFSHGLDVLHTVAVSFSLVNSENFIPDTTQFWMMVAALAHDVGHLGVNNQFLIETSHELALKYNDTSPMENMHCSLLFKLTSDPEADIFSKVERTLYQEMRKGIISVILHTDMGKHNDMVKELGVLYQMHSDTFDSLSPGTAVAGSPSYLQLILNAMVHMADLGNPTKPWNLCHQLAYLLLDEFFAQGDQERAAGIPVQMLNDRSKVNKPNSQVGFIEFMITPIVEVVVCLFPQLDGLSLRLSQNVQNWALVWQEESNPSPEAVSKVTIRVQRVAARCKAVMREIRSPEICM